MIQSTEGITLGVGVFDYTFYGADHYLTHAHIPVCFIPKDKASKFFSDISKNNGDEFTRIEELFVNSFGSQIAFSSLNSRVESWRLSMLGYNLSNATTEILRQRLATRLEVPQSIEETQIVVSNTLLDSFKQEDEKLMLHDSAALFMNSATKQTIAILINAINQIISPEVNLKPDYEIVRRPILTKKNTYHIK